MNEVEVLDLARDGMMTMLLVAGPMLLVGLVVGLAISIFQTLTHIQEMTLTFVPKIVTVLLVTALTASFMGAQIYTFTEQVYAHIEHGF